MKPSLAFLFAIVGVILLCGVGFAIAVKIWWLTLAFIVVAFGWIGFGFTVKSKKGRAA